MGGIGIVNNPASRRNRRRPEIARRLRERLGPDGEVLDAATPEALERAVERFRAARVDVLGVNGGDGTVSTVITAFARAYRDEALPRLLLLRGGAMNTVAHGNGVRGGPEAILREVLARVRAGRPLPTRERDLLRVSADGGAPRYGFIFGMGVVVSFLEAYYATGYPSPVTAGALLARASLSAMAGGAFARSLLRREALHVSGDGDDWPDASYLALAAGSTPDIGFGLRAFARCEEQPGFFHAVGVVGRLSQLVLAIPRLRLGAPWRRRLAQDELVRSLVVDGDRPRFTVDGDLFSAERAVAVETGPAVEIVVP